jgi:hypothetical protein
MKDGQQHQKTYNKPIATLMIACITVGIFISLYELLKYK